MAQQLRLVDTPRIPRPSRARPAAPVARTASPRGRRAAAWGEWRLDSHTRRIGKAGIAAARRALDEAVAAAHAVETNRRAS